MRLIPYELGAELWGTRVARRASPDVLICNAQWPAPRPRGIPRISILYEAHLGQPSPWGMYADITKREFAIQTRRCLRKSWALITLSETSRKDIAETLDFPKDRIVVAPPSLSPYEGHPRLEWALPPYVMMVGWFHPRKDLPLSLHAWRWAVERGLNRDLVLAGWEGPADHVFGSVGRRILEIVGPELARRVHYTGSIPRPDLGHVLSGTDAVILSSIHEGFGIPAIEAMSFGKPVVAVNRTSLPETIRPVLEPVEPTPRGVGSALLAAVENPPDGVALAAYARSRTAERQVAPVRELLARFHRENVAQSRNGATAAKLR